MTIYYGQPAICQNLAHTYVRRSLEHNTTWCQRGLNQGYWLSDQKERASRHTREEGDEPQDQEAINIAEIRISPPKNFTFSSRLLFAMD